MILFEALTAQHDLSRFHSGNSRLDTYLRQEALKEQSGDLARVFIAIDTEEDPQRPVGYIALKTTGVFVSSLPLPIPSDTFLNPAEIAYLARDVTWRGKGLGEILLLEAMDRIERLSPEIGLPGIFLTATKEGATLYERLFFQRIDPDEMDYYLPMVAVREILQGFGAR